MRIVRFVLLSVLVVSANGIGTADGRPKPSQNVQARRNNFVSKFLAKRSGAAAFKLLTQIQNTIGAGGVKDAGTLAETMTSLDRAISLLLKADADSVRRDLDLVGSVQINVLGSTIEVANIENRRATVQEQKRLESFNGKFKKLAKIAHQRRIELGIEKADPAATPGGGSSD